jgi:integrase
MANSTLSPQLTFSAAFEEWISRRVIHTAGARTNARYISPRTEKDLRQYARATGLFFGGFRLEEINTSHFHRYHVLRATNPPDADGNLYLARNGDTVGPFASQELAEKWSDEHGRGWILQQTRWMRAASANLIRKEVQTVMRVMRAAGAWTLHHEEVYEPLQPVQNDIQRAMNPEEQHRFLQAAGSRTEWQLVYWWSLVALQTTASTNELRMLRLGDVFLDQGTIQIRSAGAKNKFRIRTIPLQTPEVVWALENLMRRARQLGAGGPHCCLFPFHLHHDKYDVLRPMSPWGLRKPWEQVRTAAKVPWLRPYDLRHTAITRMAESGVPIQVIMSFAGHISPTMQQHYTAISMEAKRRWAATAWEGSPSPQDWRQQAITAGWAPHPPQPSPAIPTWQEQAMAAGWNPIPQPPGTDPRGQRPTPATTEAWPRIGRA